MITIRPSDNTDHADTDHASLPPEDAANSEDHKKRIPLIWIPATLGVGLLIAAIYLGGRIVKAHPQAEPEMAHVAAPVSVKLPAKPEAPPPQPLPTAEPPPETTPETTPAVPAQEFVGPEPLTVVTPEDGIPMIAPQAGEQYIQVGALDHEATRRFVQRLRKEGLDPHVATGPTPQLMRVLIGPFNNREALNERKAQIETEGIATFVRQY